MENNQQRIVISDINSLKFMKTESSELNRLLTRII